MLSAPVAAGSVVVAVRGGAGERMGAAGGSGTKEAPTAYDTAVRRAQATAGRVSLVRWADVPERAGRVAVGYTPRVRPGAASWATICARSAHVRAPVHR